MNADELFPPSEFLKSEEIEDAGGEMLLTIKSVARKEYEEEGGAKSVKGVLAFNELPKKLSLNVTNTQTLITMYGRKDIDTEWIGKSVILFVDPNVKYAGKLVKGIRVRLVDEKQDAVQAYWKKSRELGFTQPEGAAFLKTHDGDFAKATAALVF